MEGKKYSFDEVMELQKKFELNVYLSRPIVLEKAEGVYVSDINGKRYLDFTAQFTACHIGYRNREMIDALTKQLEFPYVCPNYINVVRLELAQLLAQLAPGKLSRSYFGNSGGEAIDAAIKFARKYTRKHTNGYKTISIWNSFHGSTFGGISATGSAGYWRDFEPMLPGIIHLPGPNCYRCIYHLEYPMCNLACIRPIEETIMREEGNVSNVLIEVMRSGQGVILPPETYLKELRRICDENEVLLIFDEVVTAAGRTGRMFACEHYDVAPDMLVTGKGLTSGYIPGAAVIVREDLEMFDVADPNEFRHVHTHCGTPIMCKAAITNLNIILRDKLMENATTIGGYLLKELQDLVKEFEIMGDARGKGLLCGLEIVKNKEGKEPDFDKANLIVEKCEQKGLLIQLSPKWVNSVLVFIPPLIINKEHVDIALEILRDSIKEAR